MGLPVGRVIVIGAITIKSERSDPFFRKETRLDRNASTSCFVTGVRAPGAICIAPAIFFKSTGIDGQPRAGIDGRPRAGIDGRPRAGIDGQPRAGIDAPAAGVRVPRPEAGR